jgi:hypothetical protein
MSGPTLDTARLILHPPVQADFGGFAAMSREAEAIDWTFDVRGAERLGSCRQREDVPLPPPIGGQVDVYGQTREQWQARRR